MWLLANHAVAGYFLYLAICVSNNPMAAQKLRRNIASVGYRNCVREYITINFGFGLFIDISRCNFDANFTLYLIHKRVLCQCL